MKTSGILLASVDRMSPEVFIGRSAAFCLHPYAAWRRLTNTGRALLIAAYCGTSYTLVLAVLVML